MGSESDFQPFIDFLGHGVLPKSQKKARSVLLQQSDYSLINGVLFHSRVAKSKRAKSFAHYQLALPKSLIPTVLKLHHDSTLGAHGGYKIQLIKSKSIINFHNLQL